MTRCTSCRKKLAPQARHVLCKACRFRKRPERRCAACGRRLRRDNATSLCHACADRRGGRRGKGECFLPPPGHLERIARYAERAAVNLPLFEDAP